MGRGKSPHPVLKGCSRDGSSHKQSFRHMSAAQVLTDFFYTAYIEDGLGRISEAVDIVCVMHPRNARARQIGQPTGCNAAKQPPIEIFVREFFGGNTARPKAYHSRRESICR